MQHHGVLFRRSILFTALFFFSFFAVAVHAGKYMHVAKDGVNVRSGPGEKNEILFEVFKDYPVIVLQTKGKWIKITDFEGDQGWIYSSLLNNGLTYIVKVADGNMRSGPGEKYDIIAKVKKGVVFRRLKKSGKWRNIEHANGATGWMHNSLLWP